MYRIRVQLPFVTWRRERYTEPLDESNKMSHTHTRTHISVKLN